MNKKGISLLIYTMMIAITVIVLALALAGPLKTFTDNARNETSIDGSGMNCTNPVIDDFTKAACYTTDLNLFLFVGGLIFIAGIIISAKIIFS